MGNATLESSTFRIELLSEAGPPLLRSQSSSAVELLNKRRARPPREARLSAPGCCLPCMMTRRSLISEPLPPEALFPPTPIFLPSTYRSCKYVEFLCHPRSPSLFALARLPQRRSLLLPRPLRGLALGLIALTVVVLYKRRRLRAGTRAPRPFAFVGLVFQVAGAYGPVLLHPAPVCTDCRPTLAGFNDRLPVGHSRRLSLQLLVVVVGLAFLGRRR